MQLYGKTIGRWWVFSWVMNSLELRVVVHEEDIVI